MGSRYSASTLRLGVGVDGRLRITGGAYFRYVTIAAGLACVLAGGIGTYRDYARVARIAHHRDLLSSFQNAERTNDSLNRTMAKAGTAEADAAAALSDAVNATRARYQTPDLTQARLLAVRESKDVDRASMARVREIGDLRAWLDAYQDQYGDAAAVEHAREDVARLELARSAEISYWRAAVRGVIASTGFATRSSVTFEYVRQRYADADAARTRAEAQTSTVRRDFGEFAHAAQRGLLDLRVAYERDPVPR